MSRLTSRLTAAGAIFALTLTTFGAAQPAVAAPASTSATSGSHPTEKGRHVVAGGRASDLSAKRVRKAEIVVNMVRRAKSKKGRYDYRKLNKYDRKHSTWRRQAAATIIWLGKPLDHLSKRELAKVKQYVPSRSYNKVKFDNHKKQRGTVTSFGQNHHCTGWSGYILDQSQEVPYPGFTKLWLFLNSCHSNALQFVIASEALAMTLLGFIFPPAAIVLEPAAFVYGLGALYIQLCQANSKYNALLITQDFDRLRLLSQ